MQALLPYGMDREEHAEVARVAAEAERQADAAMDVEDEDGPYPDDENRNYYRETYTEHDTWTFVVDSQVRCKGCFLERQYLHLVCTCSLQCGALHESHPSGVSTAANARVEKFALVLVFPTLFPYALFIHIQGYWNSAYADVQARYDSRGMDMVTCTVSSEAC